MAHHYIDEYLDPSAFTVGGSLALTGAEAKHAATVSRIRVGESVRVGDGRGRVATASVVSAASSRLELEVTAVETAPAPTRSLVLVQALAKGDRDELAIQAATELGVDAVVPWQASRSISRWAGLKEEKGRERWAGVVREASKQSLRAWVPEVAPLVSTAQLATLAADTRMLLLEPSASIRLTAVPLDEAGADGTTDSRDIVIVVGPEGGFAPDELERLGAAGAEAVVLGESVLRTSTAGPAALAVLNARLGRW